MASTAATRDGYSVHYGHAAPEEHHALRVAAGLSPPPRPDNELSLQNTWFGVVVRKDGEAVAMGRIIGDGAFFLVVVDICTHPNHQRRGLGNCVMTELIRYADEHAPNAYLTLLADPPGVGLYTRHGFLEDKGETPMFRSKYVSRVRAERLLSDGLADA